MKFHREGIPVIFITLLVLAGLNATFWFVFRENLVLHWLVAGVSLGFLLLIAQFFRIPVRRVILHENQILAPADGKVVVIEETQETEYFKDRRIQVSIFMSPLNVHNNRNPISGTITYFKYHPGRYLVAWHPKSSTDNERTTLVFKNENGIELLVRQIAGAMARRIKCYVKPGDAVQQGEEFGFISFGSRVDVLLPLTAQIRVSIGDVSVGGKTVLAHFE